MTDPNTSERKSRDILAFIITLVSIVGLIVISGLYIQNGGQEKVFNALLPLIATWVGTILAYYFGKENFESASRQIESLVNKITPETLKSIPVRQIMIDYDTMIKYLLPASTDNETILLKDLLAKLDDKSRLPILTLDRKPAFIIHRSEMERYLVLKADATLKDLLDKDSNRKDFANLGSRGFALVSEDALVEEALKQLADQRQDVFVTKTGSVDSPVTGWLTNTQIAKFLATQK